MISLNFDYYYGAESEQYTFFRIPKLLMKDRRFKKLSSDAKLLYGLMLDRMSLSAKNGWFDVENRVYIIYPIDEIMNDLCCARATVAKIIAELDCKKGIGLIEKKRIGLGKPDIIYVKNFVLKEPDQPCEENCGCIKKEEKEPVNPCLSTEVQNLNFKKFKNYTSGSSKIELQEVQKLNSNNTNNTNNNKTNNSEIDNSETEGASENPSIYQSEGKEKPDNGIDGIDMHARILDNIDYEHVSNKENKMLQQWNYGLYEELCRIIREVCYSPPDKKYRIEGNMLPRDDIIKKFLLLTQEHMEYVIESLADIHTRVRNIKGYMITALYNAVDTMSFYYMNMVRADSADFDNSG